MTVYIEYVIIDNMVIDAVIIYLTLRIMRHRLSALRIFLCALLGTALAIFVSLLQLGAYIIVLKILSGLVIVALMAGYRSLIHYIKTLLVFLAVTMCLGGACFMALYMASGSVEQALTMGVESVPIGLVVLPVAVASMIAFNVFKRLKRFKHTEPFFYRVELVVDGETISATGYLDSGNLLYDYAGSPIVVANRELFQAVAARKVLHGGRLGSVQLGTAFDSHQMKTCSTDKLVIYSGSAVNILYDITVGMSERDFDGFNCLLHPAVV